jgi:putative heme iron utilization protein
MRPAQEMRALVGRETHALLSTAHAAQGGWPFGSIAPYALTPEGDPVLLLSTIAEHTKNLMTDPRASLLVADSKARKDPLAGARATLLGRAAPVDGAEALVARTAYEERFPDAGERFAAHDFVLHVLRVERVRWIAGFGSMGWLDRDAWTRSTSGSRG